MNVASLTALLRLYVFTPQTLEAAKRAIANAVAAFLFATGAALLAGTIQWYVILGLGLSAAAGTFGTRTLIEGVYDSYRQSNGRVIAADVKPPAPVADGVVPIVPAQ